MGVDLKYLVVSITAIFISLAIGILIGANMKSGGFFLEQQQLLINSLEDRLTEFNNEYKSLTQMNEMLKKEVEIKDSYLNTFYEKLTYKKLENINSAIISLDIFESQHIFQAVSEAGGNIYGNIIVSSKLLNLDDQEFNSFKSLFFYNVTYEELIDKIGIDLINYLLKGRRTSLISYMFSKKYIDFVTYENINYTPIDKIIITGGDISSDSKISEAFINRLIQSCKANYIDIVGVETSSIEHSVIPVFIENGVSTVDNIDSILGKLSLVLVLSGIEGHYGETDHAYELLPIGSY